MPHCSLRSFASTLLLLVLALHLEAQAPTASAPAPTSAPTSAATDGPFAVLAADAAPVSAGQYLGIHDSQSLPCGLRQ